MEMGVQTPAFPGSRPPMQPTHLPMTDQNRTASLHDRANKVGKNNRVEGMCNPMFVTNEFVELNV